MSWLFGAKTRRELYTITRGSESFLYTSGDKDVTIDNNTWSQLTIKRGSISSSSDIEKNTLEVTFASDSEFAQSCLRSALEEVVFLTLSKYQNGIKSLLWQGRLTNVKPKDATITLTFSSDYTTLARAGVRYRYQRTCAHDLYGTGCKLNKNDWKIQTTLASVNGTSIVLRGLGGYAVNYFRLGMLDNVDGVSIGIEASSANTITLIRKLDSLGDYITTDQQLQALTTATTALATAQSAYNTAIASGASPSVIASRLAELTTAQSAYNTALSNVHYVHVYAGCMKSLTACDAFGNTDNFIGFPFVPEDNPTTTRIV